MTKDFKLLNITGIVLFLLISIYFTAKFTFGSKGILEYYNLQETYSNNIISMKFLEKEEKTLKIKLSLLNESSVNLHYLEELIRINLNFGEIDEKLIIIEDEI